MSYESQELDFVTRIRALVPKVESLRGDIKKELCYYFGQLSPEWTAQGFDTSQQIAMGITYADVLAAVTTLDTLNNALTDPHMGNLNKLV